MWTGLFDEFHLSNNVAKKRNHMKTRFKITLTALALLLLLANISVAAAQTPVPLSLRLSKDWGYASGSRIQGTFSMTATSNEPLAKVTFYLDDQPIGEAVQPPFKLQFSTEKYPPGIHTLKAVGTTRSGAQIDSNPIRADFLTSRQAFDGALTIVIPILAATFGVIFVGFAVTMVSTRRKGRLAAGAARNYGLKGGTICPKCKRPFAIHAISFNLIGGVYDFCPHCGKWSFVKSLPIETLRAAEQSELQPASGPRPVGESEDEKLRKEIENSRYREF
jgi:hypothetical protein